MKMKMNIIRNRANQNAFPMELGLLTNLRENKTFKSMGIMKVNLYIYDKIVYVKK